MSKITENLSVALDRLKELRTKFAPLNERVEKLNQKVDLISKSVSELVSEIVEVKEIVNGSASVFDSIIENLSEVEKESEQINRNIDENNELRESMTSIFGEAFNVVSRFIDTAKHIGIIDNNRAEQILAVKPLINVTKNPLPEIADANELNPQQPEISPIPTDIITENTTENTTNEKTEDAGIVSGEALDAGVIAADNVTLADDLNNIEGNITPTDNVLSNEIADNIVQTETATGNNLSALEMASQLDLQPLQFNTSMSGESEETGVDGVVLENHKSEADDEESLEAILDDISRPLST
ncbi:MAG: hypothetical protein LBJ00_06585 [Planctomycetaceae bacterium]|jgi:regulator of replication initiation timing|nr:hypothetical protein [Planctomycetaceae bacterium]